MMVEEPRGNQRMGSETHNVCYYQSEGQQLSYLVPRSHTFQDNVSLSQEQQKL
jgi:hypothetical protein